MLGCGSGLQKADINLVHERQKSDSTTLLHESGGTLPLHQNPRLVLIDGLGTNLLGWDLADAFASPTDIAIPAPAFTAAYGATSAAVVGWVRHRPHMVATSMEHGFTRNQSCY